MIPLNASTVLCKYGYEVNAAYLLLERMFEDDTRLRFLERLFRCPEALYSENISPFAMSQYPEHLSHGILKFCGAGADQPG